MVQSRWRIEYYQAGICTKTIMELFFENPHLKSAVFFYNKNRMREKTGLNSKEKVLIEILRILLIFIAAILIKGMYNQSNHIDEDYFLVPAFCTLSEIFCLIYTFNAFTTGNLVRRWASTPIFTPLFHFIKSKNQLTDNKALNLTTKAFGIFTFIVFVIIIITEIIFYTSVSTNI